MHRAISNQKEGIAVPRSGNVIRGNIARGNGDGATFFDLFDGNLPDACPNTWRSNLHQTDNDQANTCIF
jgi:hypothetical protein